MLTPRPAFGALTHTRIVLKGGVGSLLGCWRLYHWATASIALRCIAPADLAFLSFNPLYDTRV